MESQIKDYIDLTISKIGLKETKDKIKKGLEESKIMKINHLKSGKSLYNIPSHIEVQEEILNYIDELITKQRDEKLTKLLGESKVYSFSEFNKFF